MPASTFFFTASHFVFPAASSFLRSFFNTSFFCFSSFNPFFASSLALEPASFALASSSLIFSSILASFSFAVFLYSSFFSLKDSSFGAAVSPAFSSPAVCSLVHFAPGLFQGAGQKRGREKQGTKHYRQKSALHNWSPFCSLSESPEDVVKLYLFRKGMHYKET